MEKTRRHHFLPLPKRPLRFSSSRPLVFNPTFAVLLSASRTREGGTKAPSLVSLSGSAEGAGEETSCRADKNCSFEALLLREKNSLFWNCAPYVYVAPKVSIHMLYKHDVLMTSALPLTAIFWQIRNKEVKVGPCSKLQLLKLPCFWSLIIEIWRHYYCTALWDLLKIILNVHN